MGIFYIMNTPESFEMFHTMNLKTATALVTLGFTKISTEIVLRADGKESMVFWFEPKNQDGLAAGVVYHGMTKGGDELAKNDPENIVNYLREYAANRDELINEIRNTPRKIAIEKDGKTALLPENATSGTKAKIAEIF